MASREAAISKIARFMRGRDSPFMLHPLSAEEAEDLRYALETLFLPGHDLDVYEAPKESLEEIIDEVVN